MHTGRRCRTGHPAATSLSETNTRRHAHVSGIREQLQTRAGASFLIANREHRRLHHSTNSSLSNGVAGDVTTDLLGWRASGPRPLLRRPSCSRCRNHCISKMDWPEQRGRGLLRTTHRCCCFLQPTKCSLRTQALHQLQAQLGWKMLSGVTSRFILLLLSL